MHVSRVSTGNFEMERWLIHNSSLEKDTTLSPILLECFAAPYSCVKGQV